MNELTIFNNEEFGTVRTVTINNETWFVGKDVAEILGYTNSRKAITDHVDEEDKTDGVTICDSIGRTQNPIFINESGLYSLVILSKLPNAKKFKRWVTSEVLPSIRQNGAYISGQNEMSETELLAKALLSAQKIIERRDFVIKQLESDAERMRPKEIFADAVATSNTSILIGELAKLLCQNGIDIGQNRLFKWLRDNKYLMSNNMPMQRYVDSKLFEVKERTIQNPDGTVRITCTTKVTGKGQLYFINKFLGKDE